jgi:hypothetical protein
MTGDLTAAQITLAKAMPEAVLEENIRRACLQLRLMYYHTHRSQHSPAGFPDDVIMGSLGMIYRENKREGHDPTPKQQKWLDGLAAHGHDVGVWRPSDWLSGRIMAELTALSARR